MSVSIDTIAAIATPPGRGGVCIIRVSGPDVRVIAQSVTGFCPRPRYATFTRFRDPSNSDNRGNVIDEGIALYFPGPNSFTGEDVLELHGHGGTVISDMILKSVLQAGARMARPGEFSERAFLNNKLDLVQAEAVADLIDAGSAQAAKAALRTLEGEFSRHIRALLEELISLRMYVESSIDFVDEEIELLQSGDIEARLNNLSIAIDRITITAGRGCVLGEGLHLVIVGRPNAGKSSLMNILSGRKSSIVTDIPGTTRDVIRENVILEGIPVRVYDTAGIREDAQRIEEEGIRRARDALANADLVLWVHDDTTDMDRHEYEKYQAGSLVIVRNKIDKSGRSPGKQMENGLPVVAISTETLQGVDLLHQEILQIARVGHCQENDFSARRRHLRALEQTGAHLQRACEKLEKQLQMGVSGELLAEELRLAQNTLNEITGEFTTDDLLGKIFAEFCIGK